MVDTEIRGGGASLRPGSGARRTFECVVARTAGASAVLAALDAAGRACLDHMRVTQEGFFVALTGEEIELLESNGLTVKRLRELVLDATPGGAAAPLPARADDTGFQSGFVSAYLDAAQVAARISALAAQFPALCTLSTLPETTAGYDGGAPGLAGPASVQLLRITSAPAVSSRPGFLLIGGTHAREWLNPLVAIEFAEQLVRNYDPASSDPVVVSVNRIIDEGDVLVIPVLNPDGLNYSRHDDAGWRKNRRPDPGGCPGVDNNRNFEIYFGGAGASASPCADSFRGPAALSEPENRNLRWVLEQHPNILVGVDAHSSGQQVFRPNPSGGSFITSLPVSAADHAIYDNLEAVLVSAIQSVNGVTYATGTTSNHAGTSDEYMFFGHRVFGFNLECATSFQPPFPGAAAIVQEVVAGMRALAGATLDLDVTTPAPARIVQCIDRTGSMVSFGYDGAARANAKRFIDMMSLGDLVAVVTFADPDPDPDTTPLADRSRVEYPLTAFDDPGDFAVARTAVDGIAFGGWTPIGAGLERAGQLLPAGPGPRAVLLISDGFENREPLAATALAGLPAGLRVFTVALGAMADVPLLQSIASQTGGAFYSSPTALELHEIYNQVRADMTDEGLIVNDVLPPADHASPHEIHVEPGVERLLVSLSWSELSRCGALRLVAPGGRPVRADDWGVRVQERHGYALVEVARPAPGRWLAIPSGVEGHAVMAAFARSPLRVHTHPKLRDYKLGFALRATFDGRPLAPPTAVARAATVPLATPAGLGQLREPGLAWTDALPSALAIAPHAAVRTHAWALGGAAPAASPGVSNVRVRMEGRLPGGAPFTRVTLRTVVVGPRGVAYERSG